ncbi:MAG: thiamine diphosphokinase [Peptoniphilaceae bacterium]|nr:thiamine diphosphokinase [Peptoniphilaceae bacterium]MDY6018235.1 thiamine diphosphokinase [Anaerococcus sp.]
MNTCYLVGGGDFDGFFDKLDKSDYIIGVDKGYTKLKKFGLEADLIIGDFDSAIEPVFPRKIKLKPEKDMTDTYAGLEIGIKKGYKKFIVYGGLGGRLSHTIANIRMAYEFKKKGFDIIFKSKKKKVFLVDKSYTHKHVEEKDFYVSIFSLKETSFGLTLKGLKYELDNFDLSYANSLGVSNESQGCDFEIRVENGLLLVIFEDKNL